MEKNRFIHSSRESSYRIKIDGRRSDEILTVNIYGMNGEIIGLYHFDQSQLQDKNSIHFKYINGSIKWLGGVIPNSNVCGEKSSSSDVCSRKVCKKDNRDEEYVIDLCDEILGIKAKRQHRFPFLLGDSGKCLPVDAYYEDLNLVVEYCERQHSESIPFFDSRLTVSGVGRGEQRRIYDERRKEVLPLHSIHLINIAYSDFEYDSKKRIIREYQRDFQIVKNKLGI